MDEDGVIRRWPWVVAAGIVLVLLLSIQSAHELKTTPTAEFASVQALSEKPDRSQWVQTYWECARNTIQRRYPYGEKLPALPPPEFEAAKEELRRLESPDLRRRYWVQLQKDWLSDDSWDVSYRIDLGWIPAGLNKTADYIRDTVDSVLHSFHS